MRSWWSRCLFLLIARHATRMISRAGRRRNPLLSISFGSHESALDLLVDDSGCRLAVGGRWGAVKINAQNGLGKFTGRTDGRHGQRGATAGYLGSGLALKLVIRSAFLLYLHRLVSISHRLPSLPGS